MIDTSTERVRALETQRRAPLRTRERRCDFMSLLVATAERLAHSWHRCSKRGEGFLSSGVHGVQSLYRRTLFYNQVEADKGVKYNISSLARDHSLLMLEKKIQILYLINGDIA